MDDPRGLVVDLGDLVLNLRLLTKGRKLHAVWHTGAPVDTTMEDRTASSNIAPATGRIDRMADLRADKKVPLSLGQWQDEMGNPTDAPSGVRVTWTVDEAGASVVTLTDNGDGTAVLAAIGGLGPAHVHMEGTADGGVSFSGDELYMVVPGDAVRVTIETGAEEEVTPDESV